MKRKIKSNTLYHHFKGQDYKVLYIAKDCNDIKKLVVVYEAMYGDHTIWVRDYDEFASLVDHKKYPDIIQKYRFEEIKELSK